MRKIQKLIAITISMIMIMMALSACGNTPSEAPNTGATETDTTEVDTSEEDASEEQVDNEEEQDEVASLEGTGDVTLKLTWPGGGQNRAELLKCLEPFTEATGIGIDLVFITGNWGEYFTTIQTMIAGGEAPDLSEIAIEGFDMFVYNGLATPMNDWIAENQEDYDRIANDIDPNVMNILNYDGLQYGIPTEWNNVVTHINTKLLEEAGLELPPADWNQNTFLEYAEKMTVQREDGSTQFGMSIPHAYFELTAWMYNWGTSLLNDDMTEGNLEDPKVIEAFQFMYDLVYEYGYSPIPEAGVDRIQLMQDGEIAMFFAGRWPTTQYVANDFKDVAIQYMPTFETNVPVWGGTSTMRLTSSQHLEEAHQLALYLASPEFIEKWLAYGPIPVLNSVAEEKLAELGIPQNYEIYIESAATARPVQSPQQYAEVSVAVIQAFNDIMINKADIEETLSATNAQLNMILMD